MYVFDQMCVTILRHCVTETVVCRCTKNSCSKKFINIHMKTVGASFYKAEGFNFSKKIILHGCFTVNIEKHL